MLSLTIALALAQSVGSFGGCWPSLSAMLAGISLRCLGRGHVCLVGQAGTGQEPTTCSHFGQHAIRQSNRVGLFLVRTTGYCDSMNGPPSQSSALSVWHCLVGCLHWHASHFDMGQIECGAKGITLSYALVMSL